MSRNNGKMINEEDLTPRITVVGVGGAGGNAVNNMIRANLEGVDFIVANTDAQALSQSMVEPKNRMQLGLSITQGLGAGSKPDVGQAAAEESLDDIFKRLEGSNMVFITAGMGGGTGTGAAPVIARAARESGILTVGVVTKPFHFEGTHRMRSAERGIEDLHQFVDTLIIIPNQNLFRLANERTTFADAFKMADDVLYSGVRGITDLILMPGLINLDFADIRAVMAEMGKAMMGTGEADGERRALDAAEAAISNPLLDDVSMRGAKAVLINITGGYDMTLYELDEAANRIREDVESDANIIFGSSFDEKLNGRIRVSVVATGIGGVSNASQTSLRKGFSSVNEQSPSLSTLNPQPTTHQQPGMSMMNNFTTLAAATRSNIGKPTPTGFSEEFLPSSASSFENSTQTHVEHEFSNHPLTDSNSFEDSATSHFQNNNQSIENSLHQQQNPQKSMTFSQNHGQTEEAPRKKSPSLFERFTGASRSKSQQQPTSSMSTEKMMKDEHVQNADNPNDLLDIPAFLRRGGGSS